MRNLVVAITSRCTSFWNRWKCSKCQALQKLVHLLVTAVTRLRIGPLWVCCKAAEFSPLVFGAKMATDQSMRLKNTILNTVSFFLTIFGIVRSGKLGSENIFKKYPCVPVSYTHLTLPTILRV